MHNCEVKRKTKSKRENQIKSEKCSSEIIGEVKKALIIEADKLLIVVLEKL